MKTTYWIGAVVVVLLVVGLIIHAAGSSNNSAQQTASSTQAAQDTQSATISSTSVTTQTTVTQGSASAPKATPAARHFTVNGNDATADVKSISVSEGIPVSITFGADAGTTYHGGLDFRSSVINTGTIVPGTTKTITFTPTKSFSFTPYWPATNIAKPYTIDVVVQ